MGRCGKEICKRQATEDVSLAMATERLLADTRGDPACWHMRRSYLPLTVLKDERVKLGLLKKYGYGSCSGDSWQEFVDQVRRDIGDPNLVKDGRFGAKMQVEICNDGPV
eukprot:764416-Hanusia_phi.AAC.3